MRKRYRIALAVLLVAVAGVIAWELLRLREPLYQGKALTVWLTPQRYSGTFDAWQAQVRKADEAVLRIGSKAVPALLRMLQAKDSALKVSLINLARRQHIIRIEYTSAAEWHHRARHGFEVLGAQGKSAVPALIDIANQNISRTSELDAIDALGFIGPSAEQAVPSLLRWATNADSEMRCNAILALGKIHSDPDRVVLALTNALQDSYVPARIDALIALQHFGPDAKLAVPALLEFLKSDNTTRSIDALKAIDPEAAAKAGVK